MNSCCSDQQILTNQSEIKGKVIALNQVPATKMPMEDELNALKMMEDLRKGEPDAMQYFFTRFYGRLCYFAARLVKNRQVAEEIVEDSFLKLWRKQTDFETVQNVRAFLYISTRNACLNWLKQEQRDEASRRELAYLYGDVEDYVLNSIVRAETLNEILQEIEKLPTQSRKVFKMSVMSSMKNQEIAQALNISVNTVRNQKMRATQLLRMSLLPKKEKG